MVPAGLPSSWTLAPVGSLSTLIAPSDDWRRAWMRAIDPWELFEADLDWVRDAGDGLVVSCHWGRMRGRAPA